MPTYKVVSIEENDKKTHIIITVKDTWNDCVKETIKITKGQKIFLDWLIDNDYIVNEYEFEKGPPKVVDLTN